MLQNYFEIRQGGKTLRRRNSVNNPFAFYKEMRVMCAYIYIRYGDGNYVFKTPTLRDFNFDPDKGGLYACYETTLDADELSGETIEATGFSASASALNIVNTVVAGVEKTAGEPLYICGTMVLSAAGEGFTFLSGDNRLARMLLGTEAFSAAEMSVVCGLSNTPTEGYTYTQTVPPSSVSPVFGEKEISFSKTFYLPATDIVLLTGGKPALRALADLPQTEETKLVSAPQNDYITVNVTDMVTEIKDLRVVNLLVDFTAVRVPSGLNYKKTAKIRLPAGAKIIRNASGNYFGYACGGRAAAFRLASGEIDISRFFAAKDIVIADDGAVFGTDDEGAVFFAGTDSADGLFRLGITAGDKYAAAYSGGAYVFGTHKAGRAVFYKITPVAGKAPEVSVLSDTQSESDPAFVHVFAAVGCVCIAGRATAALCYDPSGALIPQRLWLDGIIDASWFMTGVFPTYDGGRLVLYNSYTDQSVFYTYMKSARQTAAGYGRIYGELCVRNRADLAEVSPAGGGAAYISAQGRAACAVTHGRFFYLFLENGETAAYYIPSQSQRLYAGAITQGQTVSYVQRSVLPPATGALTLKIRAEE